MRLRRPFAVVAVALLAAAGCGGGQDPTLEESSNTSNPSSSLPAESVPSSDTTAPVASDTTVVVTGDTVVAETVPEVVEVPPPPPGTPTYAPPAAGTYTYRKTAGSGPAETTTVIERLSDTDVRQTGAGFTGGQQIAELSFRGNEVRLTRLVVTVPLLGTKEFVGDVLFTPIPPAGNWSWSLTSTDRSVTVNQTAVADPATNTVTSTIQALGQTITLVITYDLDQRMPSRIQTTGGGQNNTSELVGFTPA